MATPEFLISQMRLLTAPEMTFFYVTNQPTTFAGLEKDLDPLLDSLYAAKEQAGLDHTGECREWNYHFESVDSPNNLIGLYMEVVRNPTSA